MPVLFDVAVSGDLPPVAKCSADVTVTQYRFRIDAVIRRSVETVDGISDEAGGYDETQAELMYDPTKCDIA